MTLREYVYKYYSGIKQGIENGMYGNLKRVFFKTLSELSFDSDQVNYTPFDYSDETTPTADARGGIFSEMIAYYIGENFIDEEMNEKYVQAFEISPEEMRYSLKEKIYQLQIKYRYKWHGLHELMQLDGEYDPLDNVNEVSTETTIRTPNLSRVETSNNSYGQKQQDTTDNLGTVINTDINAYGEKHVIADDIQGQYVDVTNFTKGDVTTKVYDKAYPYDDDLTSHTRTEQETIVGQDPQVPDVTRETNGERENSSEITQDAVTDRFTKTQNATVNTQRVIDGSHIDTSARSESETGNETTTYNKLRHGNIGVTTSFQLIGGDRELHNYELVSIVAKDICNEIFDCNWF